MYHNRISEGGLGDIQYSLNNVQGMRNRIVVCNGVDLPPIFRYECLYGPHKIDDQVLLTTISDALIKEDIQHKRTAVARIIMTMPNGTSRCRWVFPLSPLSSSTKSVIQKRTTKMPEAGYQMLPGLDEIYQTYHKGESRGITPESRLHRGRYPSSNNTRVAKESIGEGTNALSCSTLPHII